MKLKNEKKKHTKNKLKNQKLVFINYNTVVCVVILQQD